ncbi:MAG TPA: hypothetical protein VMT63_10655 [Bacteroidales bacterium]|nr:hypothetical protein [Bacteroidales bacterium]
MEMKIDSRHIHFCFDRVIAGDNKIEAMNRAIYEDKRNKPVLTRLPGMSVSPQKMALITGKMWSTGRVLNICFLDGSKIQRNKTIAHASGWLKYANIGFSFNSAQARSDIRISFESDPGSWSYIGTDNINIPKNKPTMNFGWLTDNTADEEYNRVVLHEFGHALGCIHEHQNPKGGLKWNEEAVYKFFAGPPNNWSRDDTYQNVIQKYSLDQLNATKFDPKSIMLYSFPAELLMSGVGTQENDKLSRSDMLYIRKMYPK